MTLNLKRPLAFFDLETTGVNVATDRIVEISILKVDPAGTEERMTYRVNPQMPIPLESSLVHGIYEEDVKDEPTFQELAPRVAEFLKDADLAGYNSNKFDIPLLLEEFIRAGVDFDLESRHFVDVQNVFHQMEQRTLKAAYAFYCQKDLSQAHSAEADVLATYEVLKAQIIKYEGVEWEDKKGNKSVPVKNDVEALHAFTNLNRTVDFAGRLLYNEEGKEIFGFGKHRGKLVEEVLLAEPSYYSWMMQGDFPQYTKRCMEKIWNRCRGALKKPNPPAQKPANASEGQKTSGQFPPKQRKPKHITPDMLKDLQDRFKK